MKEKIPIVLDQGCAYLSDGFLLWMLLGVVGEYCIHMTTNPLPDNTLNTKTYPKTPSSIR